MQKMKIRLGGVLAGRVAQKLGINITTVAASELYESLQRGVIDGGEFSTPCSDDSLKLQEDHDPNRKEGKPVWVNIQKVYDLLLKKAIVIGVVALFAIRHGSCFQDIQKFDLFLVSGDF